MAHWNLIIEDDTGKAMAVPLTRDEVTIGRKEGNTIRLTERNVSRFHAKLKKVEGTKVHIEDLGSYNGIKINGDKISGQVEIREGDLIEIGDYHLALQAVGMSEAADAPAEPATAPAGAPSPLSLQTTQGAPAEDENDEFAGDTQRWEPPVGMEPVAVGMATVDDQAALADGLLSPQNVSGIGSPTLDERPAVSSSPAGNGSGESHAPADSEATVRNQSAPILPAPGTPIGDISGDDTEAIPVARSDAPTLNESQGANEAGKSEGAIAAAPVSAMASLAGIEDEPTEAHPSSGSIGSGASGSPLSQPGASGSQEGLLPPPALITGGATARADASAGPPNDAQSSTLPDGTPALTPADTGAAAAGAPPPRPAASPPNPAQGSSPKPAAAPAMERPALERQGPTAASAPAPQVDDAGPKGQASSEYTDIVRAAPGPRKQQTDTPRLVVLNSVFAGSVYALQSDELVIGRIEDNDITIEHRSVSRHHAKVVKEGNGYRIVDLGSANGILLNGLETDGAVLKSGDVIELGRIRIRFVPTGEAFELTSEEIARARKADALGEDDFDDGPQTAFINTNAPAAVADNGNGSTVVILIAAAFVIILLLVVIVFLLLRPPADAEGEENADPAPAVAMNEDATASPAGTGGDSNTEPAGNGATGEGATGEGATGEGATGQGAAGDTKTPDVAAKKDSNDNPAIQGDTTDPEPADDVATEPPEATPEAAPTKTASSDGASEAEKKKREREAAKVAAAKRRADRARRARLADDNIKEARGLFLARKLDSALAKAMEADRLKPRDGAIHRFIGAIYLEKKNKAKAKKHFQLALKYRPNADWADHTRQQLAGL